MSEIIKGPQSSGKSSQYMPPVEPAAEEPVIHIPNFRRKLMETINPLPCAIADVQQRTEQARRRFEAVQAQQKIIDARAAVLPGLPVKGA